VPDEPIRFYVVKITDTVLLFATADHCVYSYRRAFNFRMNNMACGSKRVVRWVVSVARLVQVLQNRVCAV
jgi:hypothetical protein